jgi:hypothetical protein
MNWLTIGVILGLHLAFSHSKNGQSGAVFKWLVPLWPPFCLDHSISGPEIE